MRTLAACGLMLLALDAPLAARRPAADGQPRDRQRGLPALRERGRGPSRARRLVSEDEFIRLARLPGTVILDARSRPKYDALHVRGAINLSFPDITVDEPRRGSARQERARSSSTATTISRDAPDPFPTKLPAAALNLVDVHVAVHVRLSQRVRAGAAARRADDANPVRPRSADFLVRGASHVHVHFHVLLSAEVSCRPLRNLPSRCRPAKRRFARSRRVTPCRTPRAWRGARSARSAISSGSSTSA